MWVGGGGGCNYDYRDRSTSSTVSINPLIPDIVWGLIVDSEKGPGPCDRFFEFG